MANTTCTNITLPDPMYEALNIESESSGLSQSQIVREALAFWFNHKRGMLLSPRVHRGGKRNAAAMGQQK